MSFRKRNKIKLPGISKEEDVIEYSDTQKPKVALGFDHSDLDDEDDQVQPAIKLKKGLRKNLVHSTTLNEDENTNQEGSSNLSKVTHNNTDAYGTLFKGKGTKNVVLNLENESEIDDIEIDNNDEEHENDGILTSEQIREVKQKKDALRRKDGRKKEVEKDKFSERDYAKLLTSEEKADLLDTYKDNGGIQKANDYNDVRQQEGLIDDIIEDGRLALTDKERIREKENRREMIEEAAKNDFSKNNAFFTTAGDYNSNFVDAVDPIHPETLDECDYSEKGKHKCDGFKTPKRPILWPKNDELEGDELIDSELAKLRIKMKTVQIRYSMLESEKKKLVSNGNDVLIQLLNLQEDK
ncbi:hypothetical protein C6P45_003811 [Maudiozyma exigua]|uniref:Uncharacterized protein n=1 Tax=Maudiozyma exigua TaxID=34358 RepID=A0A9P6WBD6_MAUEX|nr:hypothetical protein C6P45_003811 [Kazachstania exigua]